MMQTILAGLILGMVSSMHCVGMCGPIGLSLPVRDLNPLQRTFSLSLYHLGRISTYSIFGFVFGLLGRRIYISGYQQGFSILLGVFMLILLIQYFGFKNSFQPAPVKRFYQGLQEFMLRVWKNPSMRKFYLIGLANGLLPCGMVYVALAGALSSASLTKSVLFMAMFGAGTLPALVGLRYFASFLTMDTRNRFKKLTPYFIGIMALILILRGMNLGLPFISPRLPSQAASSVSCP